MNRTYVLCQGENSSSLGQNRGLPMGGWIRAALAPVVRGVNRDPLYQKAIHQSGSNAGLGLFQVFHPKGSGNYGRQQCFLTVDHNLIKLFLSPGGAALGAQVVQNQQGHSLDLLEKLVVPDGAV